MFVECGRLADVGAFSGSLADGSAVHGVVLVLYNTRTLEGDAPLTDIVRNFDCRSFSPMRVPQRVAAIRKHPGVYVGIEYHSDASSAVDRAEGLKVDLSRCNVGLGGCLVSVLLDGSEEVVRGSAVVFSEGISIVALSNSFSPVTGIVEVLGNQVSVSVPNELLIYKGAAASWAYEKFFQYCKSPMLAVHLKATKFSKVRDITI